MRQRRGPDLPAHSQGLQQVVSWDRTKGQWLTCSATCFIYPLFSHTHTHTHTHTFTLSLSLPLCPSTPLPLYPSTPQTQRSTSERALYKEAVNALKASGQYDAFVHVHAVQYNKDFAHGTGGFLPWHRWYLIQYEDALRKQAPKYQCLTVPYWDWAEEALACMAKGGCNTLDEEVSRGPAGWSCALLPITHVRPTPHAEPNRYGLWRPGIFDRHVCPGSRNLWLVRTRIRRLRGHGSLCQLDRSLAPQPPPHGVPVALNEPQR